ncbi:MAG TPA: LysR substrate-binding domain-containing protein [Streptosporangiaceae bacterium]
MLDVTRLRVLVAVARHGSVTAAARALNYAQPSVSHHIARLEAETGARLTQRAGRGVRLTDAGRLLAERAEEIIGRLDAAENELAAHVGLRGGRIRLAAFPSALGTIVPAAAARLEAEHPGMDLTLAEAEPPEALRMLRAGYVDVALVFRHTQDGVAAAPSETDDGTRATLLLDDPIYLVTQACTSSSSHHPRSPDPRSPDHPRSPDPRSPDPRSPDPRSPDPRSPDPRSPDPRSPHPRPARVAPPGERALPAEPDLADFADRRWIAGCERCRSYLLLQCEAAGFAPKIAFTTDDFVAVQALVAAGLGVTTLPGLALRAARHPGIQAAALPGAHRQVLAVTYGEPPDAPAVARLLEVLTLTVGAEHPAPLPRTPIHAVDSR